MGLIALAAVLGSVQSVAAQDISDLLHRPELPPGLLVRSNHDTLHGNGRGQPADVNELDIRQTGFGNLAAIQQTGAMNTIVLTQAGTHNQAVIRQH